MSKTSKDFNEFTVTEGDLMSSKENSAEKKETEEDKKTDEDKMIIVENISKESEEIHKLGKSSKWKPYLNSKTVEYDYDEHGLEHSPSKNNGFKDTESR
jgi:hypothetical protein